MTDLNSGVYAITSEISPDRVYIGSATDIKKRWNAHIERLRKCKHHSKKLQRHYNKYGEDDLTFSILAYCSRESLTPMDGVIWPEQCFIWAYKPYFNVCQWAGSSLGRKASKETRTLLSEVHKGEKNPNYQKPMSEEQKKKISETLRRHPYKHTPEQLEKMRIASTGRKHTPEAKAKIAEANRKRKKHITKITPEEYSRKLSEGVRRYYDSLTPEDRKKRADKYKGHKAWNKGVPCSEETKEKISKKTKGMKRSDEVKEKISKGLKGKPKSEETKRKLSEIAKNRPRKKHSEETKRKISESNKKWALEHGKKVKS